MSNSTQNIIQKTVVWLQKNRWLNIIVAIAFSCFIIFMHDSFVNVSVKLMNAYSLAAYDKAVAIIVFVIGVAVVSISGYKIYVEKSFRRAKIFFLVASFTLLTIHFFVLTEMSIEMIHALMYFGLSFLLFPLFGRYSAAIIFALLVMIIDEWYQYKILYPSYVTYYELNDILLDVLGSGLLVTLLFVFGVKNNSSNTAYFKKSEFVLLGTILFMIFLGLATCFFSLYPENSCGNTIFVFNNLPNPHLFWQVHPFNKAVYHVMNPIQGIAIITFTTLFFCSVSRIQKNNTAI